MIYKTTMISSILANAMASKPPRRGVTNFQYWEDDEKLAPPPGPDDTEPNSVNALIRSRRLQLLKKHVDGCGLDQQPCECPLHCFGGGISGRAYKVMYDGQECALKVCTGVDPNNQELRAYEMVRDMNIEGVIPAIHMWNEKDAPENLDELFEIRKQKTDVKGGILRTMNMKGVCQFLVLELGEGSLGEKLLEVRKNFSKSGHTEEEVAKATCTFLQWARDLAAAYKNIHENNIIHIDGKVDNVIMIRRGDQLVPKLIDLDAMYRLDKQNEQGEYFVEVKGRQAGNSWCPEIENTQRASKASDIFAFGYTLESMFHCLGLQAFSPDRISALLTCITACRNMYAPARPDINDVWNLLKYEHLLAAGQEVENGKSAKEESGILEDKMKEMIKQEPPAPKPKKKDGCCTISR